MEGHYEKLIVDESYIEYFINFLNVSFRNSLDNSKEIIDNLLKIAEEKDYQLVKAWGNAYLGWYFHDLSNYYEAVKKHNKACDIFTNINNVHGQIFSLNGLMADYIQLGFYDFAIESGLKGLEIGEGKDLEQKMHSLRINTAISYIRLKLYDNALEIFNDLDKIPYENSMEAVSIINYSKAEVYMNKNELHKAMEYVNKAYSVIETNSYTDNVMMADVLYVRAQIFEKMGNEYVAKEEYEKALQISEEHKSKDVSCLIMTSLGSYYCSKKLYPKALDYLLKSLDYANEIESLFLKAGIVKELSNLYKSMGNYKQALEYADLCLTIDKEVFTKQSGLWLAKLQDKQIKRQAKVYKSLYNEIALLSSIGQKITSNLSLENILHNVYNEVNTLFNFDIIGIALYKEEEEVIDYSLFIEEGVKVAVGSTSIHKNESFGSYCLKNKESILINNRELEYSRYITKSDNYIKTGTDKRANSLIYSPLTIENKSIGFLSIQSYEKNVYSMDDLNKIKILASYLAIALANATLFNEVEFFASHDYLTGLWNRKEVCERGQKAFNKLKKYGEEFSIIMGDVDKFKSVNDTYGHLVGDEVLKMVASTIKETVRTYDYIGRYGGEEFIIILPNTNEDGAKKIAERIRFNVENNKILTKDNRWASTTISLGVFQCKKNIESLDVGLNKADEALYRAKNAGRNRVVIY